jgi:predicted thioesterase
VTAKVKIEKIDGRRIHFSAEVFDEKEKVGEGTHLRVIVDHSRFLQGAKSKTV